MAEYARIFAVENVAAIHRAFDRDFALAEQVARLERQAGLPPTAQATLRLLERAYLDFTRSLDTIAASTARQADAAIKDRIKATAARNRGDTGKGSHLRNFVRSQPLGRLAGLPSGAVGIASITLLDSLVNPIGHYGAYWRAQEYGTGTAGIPTQRGRVIRGYFMGRGYSGGEVPLGQYRGLGVGPHPLFVSGAAGAAMFGALGFAGGPGAQGGRGGYGTISVDLPGRHFIRDGANQAEANYRRAMQALEFRTLRDLRAAIP